MSGTPVVSRTGVSAGGSAAAHVVTGVGSSRYGNSYVGNAYGGSQYGPSGYGRGYPGSQPGRDCPRGR
ncbi:MAG: hypothetical protein ACRDPM_24565 [Solirubrobacteraceae bacterium]